MKHLFIIIIVLSNFAGFSQESKIQKIKNSSEYYWGEGTANSPIKAKEYALKDLIGQISVQVESKMQSKWEESGDKYFESTESVTSTYSAATLNRLERIEVREQGKVKMFVYLTKAKMEEIFAARINKIQNYINSAILAEQKNEIGIALKCYNWAYALTLSHPDYNKIEADFSGSKKLIVTTIPHTIISLLQSVKTKIVKADIKKGETQFLVNFYNEKGNVQNLDFSYFTGETWTVMTGIKDGLADVSLYDKFAKNQEVKIRIEYNYIEAAATDKEVFTVLENINAPYIKESEQTIRINNAEPEKQNQELTTANNVADIKNTGKEVISTVDAQQKYIKVIYDVKMAISQKNIMQIEKYCTTAGFADIKNIFSYGSATILPQKENIKLINMDNCVIARSVLMSFYFKNSNRKFIEKVNFVFNENDKISGLSFSLSENAINDILDLPTDFASDINKYRIIQFMEDYKTAYCFGDIEYLNKVFSEDAFILVGRKMKKDPNPRKIDAANINLKNSNYEFIQKSKGEYIESLARVFMNNEFVNIQFEDNTVKRVKRDEEVYGIQIAQNYYSTNYADKGYLFLMIDLNDNQNPKIYIRTWQPEKNEDGSIIGVENFKI